MVRVHPGSLFGLLVQREDAGVACRKSEFKSPAVHYHSGPWSNGKTPARQVGDPGSTPGGSTAIRKVARYGLLGHGANVVLPRGDEGSTPLPSAHAPMVKRTSYLASN